MAVQTISITAHSYYSDAEDRKAIPQQWPFPRISCVFIIRVNVKYYISSANDTQLTT